MGFTTIPQSTDIDQSAVYSDALTIANAESSATNIEDDLNYIRTQLKNVLGTTNWFDTVPTDLSSVDLDTTIDNQGATAATQGTNINVNITDTFTWGFNDSAGDGILDVTAAAAGDTVNVGTATNAAAFKGFGTGEFVDGLTADTGGTTINIGTTAGRIDATAIELESTTGDLNLDSAAELYFADSRDTTAVPWSDASNTFAGLTGNPYTSLMDAMEAALTNTAGAPTRANSSTTGAISANTVVAGPGAVATQNTDADLVDYTGKTFVTEVMIWINGVLQKNGADASANHDCYPATVAGDITAGGFFAEKNIKNNSNLTMLVL